MACCYSPLILARVLVICILVTKIRGQRVTCSDLDSQTNTCSIPELPSVNAAEIASTYDVQVANIQHLVIYTVPTSGCNGTVEAVELCYFVFNDEDIVTLLTLSKERSSIFTVRSSITIQTTPSQDSVAVKIINGHSYNLYCGRYNLDPFDLPQAFAVNSNTLVIFNNYNKVEDYRVTNIIETPNVGSQIDNAIEEERNLAVFRLVIGSTNIMNTITEPNIVPGESLTDAELTNPLSDNTMTSELGSSTAQPSVSLFPNTLPSTTSIGDTSEPDTDCEPTLPILATSASQLDQLYVGLAVSIAVIAIILSLLLFMILKWKRISKPESPHLDRKQPKVEVPPLSHTLKQSFNEKFESEVGQNHIMQADSEKTRDIHTDMNLETGVDFLTGVDTQDNEAYGIGCPSQDDEDSYENIDNLASLSTFIPEAENYSSITPQCEIIPAVPSDNLCKMDIQAAVSKTANSGVKLDSHDSTRLQLGGEEKFEHAGNCETKTSTDDTVSNGSVAQYCVTTLPNSTISIPIEADSTGEKSYESAALCISIQDASAEREHIYDYIPDDTPYDIIGSVAMVK